MALCRKALTLGRLAAVGGKPGKKYLNKLSQHFKTCNICKGGKVTRKKKSGRKTYKKKTSARKAKRKGQSLYKVKGGWRVSTKRRRRKRR